MGDLSKILFIVTVLEAAHNRQKIKTGVNALVSKVKKLRTPNESKGKKSHRQPK